MKTLTETLQELQPLRFSQVIEQFADLRETLAEKRRATAIKWADRPVCLWCGEKVGRCKMRRAK